MLQLFVVEQIIFKYSYFPSTILEWNNLDIKIRKPNSLMAFKNSLLRVGRPTAKPTSGIHNPISSKFLTRLRLGLSHLKFKHNFKDCVNLLCSCSLESEPSPIFSAMSLFDKHTLNPLR